MAPERVGGLTGRPFWGQGQQWEVFISPVLGSIGIQIGGYSSLAPERRGDLSRLALRAMLGGLLTTCLVACVAGVLV